MFRRTAAIEQLASVTCFAVVTLCLAVLPASSARSQAVQKETDASRDVDGRAPEDKIRKQQREENLKLMEQRAAGTKVRFADKETPAGKLVPAPLFHYTDELRRIVDATLWSWTIDGRLVGICKIEKYEQGAKPGAWLYCFASLSPQLVEAEWADGHRFSARKPGIARRQIKGAPPPSDNKAVRLRQMKELASRFSSTLVDVNSDDRQEMRLLSRPLYRYEAPVDNLMDGAVFGLTANGTNPDAILVIELQQPAEGKPEYVFAMVGMTQQGLIVKFDDKQVWSKPHVPAAGDYDTWTYFWEKP